MTESVPEQSSSQSAVSPLVIIVTIVLVLGAAGAWLLVNNEPEEPPKLETVEEVTVAEPEPSIEELVVTEPEPIPEPKLITPPPVTEPEPVEVEPLPLLDNSDSWVSEKLSSLSWRTELLRLVVTDDMIRRFVVFTDNFAQGVVAYEHSPVVVPKQRFSALEIDNGDTWVWDESSSRRFDLYIELLQSVDSDTLVAWYIEAKPLIDQAYGELGYPDSDFTDTLLTAIERVLERPIMKSSPEIVRPNVIYKFADKNIENLSEADKLLIRLGKENLLMVKKVLIDVNEGLKKL